MRTLKQLDAYFKKHKIGVKKNYSSYELNVGGTKKSYNDWGERKWYFEGGITIRCEINQASFCCGVCEMGSFGGGKEEDAEHWKALIEYILRCEKLTYLRTETITDGNPHTAIEKALKEIGFRLVTTVPSKHGKREGKKYDIHVWEWLKPEK